MQISSTTPIPPVSPADRQAANAQAQAKTQDAVAKLKSVDEATNQPKVFTPAPPLRPNVQDYVDIDRTLINLRQSSI